MTSCRDVRALLSVWSSGDLPDAAALHMDKCPRCRAQFDALYPPWPVAAMPTRATTPRHMPLLTAAALLLVLGQGLRPSAELGPQGLAQRPGETLLDELHTDTAWCDQDLMDQPICFELEDS